MAMVVEVSSLAELEREIEEVSSGGQRPVQVRVTRIGDLFEASQLLHRLQKLAAQTRNLWLADDGSLAALLQASEYYQKLDLLELHLDLMKLDIEAGIAMRKIRFDGVRQTANEVVANAHPTSTFEVLDTITIEGQRIARVANLLGFGGADVEGTKLTDDDLDWFLAGAGEAEGAAEADLGLLPFEVDKEAGLLFESGEGGDKIGIHLGDKEVGLPFGSDEGDLSSWIGDLHLGAGQKQYSKAGALYLGVGEGKVVDGLADGSTLHLGDREGKLGESLRGTCGGDVNIEVNADAKEVITRGLLLHKISELREVLQKTKRGPFVV